MWLDLEYRSPLTLSLFLDIFLVYTPDEKESVNEPKPK